MAAVEWFTPEQRQGPHEILSRYDQPIARFSPFGYEIIGYIRRSGPDDNESVDVTPPEGI